MKTKFKYGNAAKYCGALFWFNLLPYIFIVSHKKGVIAIQAGWLFWDIAWQFTFD